MKSMKLPLNLQFFAEEDVVADDVTETGVNTEVAEPSEQAEGATEEPTTDESQEKPWKNDTNAGFAAARRQAEREFRAEIRERDAKYAERFKGFTNPITGMPISSEQDYFDALDAQEELNRRQQLQQQGIDTQLLDDLISHNPTVVQAQKLIHESQQRNNEQRFINELSQIMAIDPTIKTQEDLLLAPNFNEILSKTRAGYSLVDAYKITNYDRLTQQTANASKQAAINSVKGKNHLTTTSSVTDTSTDMDIPVGELSRWREMFPEATEKELKEKYTRATKALG